MGEILESVKGAMGKYGYEILNVLITDVRPERSVTGQCELEVQGRPGESGDVVVLQRHMCILNAETDLFLLRYPVNASCKLEAKRTTGCLAEFDFR